MLELVMRIEEAVFRHDIRSDTYVPAPDINPAQFPGQNQLMLVTTSGHWWGEPSGPISFIELKAPGRVGLVTQMCGADGSFLAISLTFEMTADAREGMYQLSPNWTDHIHVNCAGRLTIDSVSGRPVWHPVRRGGRTPEVLRDALDAVFRMDAHAAKHPELLRHNMLALRGYWAALALERLNPREFQASPGLESERPPYGFDEFVRHLYMCTSCSGGQVCGDARSLLGSFNGSGRLWTRLRRAVLAQAQPTSFTPVDSDVWTLLKASSATSDQRRAALDALVSGRLPSLIDALPEMNRRWPVASASRAGAPFSALAWAALVGSRVESPPMVRKRQAIGRSHVIASGWSLAEADTMIRLFGHRALNGSDNEAILAAVALGELVSRHSDEIPPPIVTRVWSLHRHASNPEVQAIVETTGARLLRFVLDVEGRRRLLLSPAALEARAESLWPAIEGMPVGTMATRIQMLTIFEQFDFLRDRIAQHMRRVDPDCLIIDAFVYPVPMAPLERLDELAQMESANTAAVDEAVQLLNWAWAALRSAPTDVAPPLPSFDATKVGGSLNYWRQFLWGAPALTGVVAHRYWPEIIAHMQAANLPPSTENMGWLSLGAGLRRYSWPSSCVTPLARERALMLLREPPSLHDDQRLVSLLSVLAIAEPDTALFAEDWCCLETAIASRVGGQTQRCINVLLNRSDLAHLLCLPEIQMRFSTFLVDSDPYLAGTAVQLLFESLKIRDAVRWMFHKSVFKSYWSLPTSSWRASVAQHPENLLQLTVELLVDFTLRRVGVIDEVNASLSALRTLVHIDLARGMETARLVIHRQQFDVVLPWIRDLPTNVRLDESLVDEIATDLAASAGRHLGLAITILRDAEERGVMELSDRWATITQALIAEVERCTNVESAAWALAGLIELPHQHRPPLERFTIAAQRLIVHIADINSSALMPLTLYLAAVGNPEQRGEQDRRPAFSDHVKWLVDGALESEPPPHVLNLVASILEYSAGSQPPPEVRAALIAALSGEGERRMSASTLEAVRDDVRRLPKSPRDPQFRSAAATLRRTLCDVEQSLDFDLVELLVPLGLELDDILDARTKDLSQPRNAIAAVIQRWSTGMIDRFVSLWRVGTILAIRKAVSYGDALLHDALHGSEDIDDIGTLIEEDLLRRISSKPQRHKQPWDLAYRVVIDTIAHRGWREVSVDQQISTAPLGGPERPPRFSPDDLATIVENLISNAIPYGGTYVVVDREKLEIVNVAPDSFTPSTAKALERYLQTGRPPDSALRINRGLKNIRRCLFRNSLLGIAYRIIQPGDAPIETTVNPDHRLVVASVTWLPPRIREIRGSQ